jgi:hypothetical protein
MRNHLLYLYDGHATTDDATVDAVTGLKTRAAIGINHTNNHNW